MYLAKLGEIELLKKLFKKVVVPDEVYEEVVLKGKEGGFLDSLIIEKAVKDGWLQVKKVRSDADVLRFAPELDAGEVEVLCLARKIKPRPDLLLIDDASARAIAESFGFSVKGTLYVILMAFRKGLLTKNEAKEHIDKLVLVGFRISQEIYLQLIKELESA